MIRHCVWYDDDVVLAGPHVRLSFSLPLSGFEEIKNINCGRNFCHLTRSDQGMDSLWILRKKSNRTCAHWYQRPTAFFPSDKRDEIKYTLLKEIETESKQRAKNKIINNPYSSTCVSVTNHSLLMEFNQKKKRKKLEKTLSSTCQSCIGATRREICNKRPPKIKHYSGVVGWLVN